MNLRRTLSAVIIAAGVAIGSVATWSLAVIAATDLVVGTAAVLSAGCATVQPILTKVEHAVDCSANQVVNQLPGIVTDVTTDLLSQNYAKLLTDLAQRVGDDLVVCAVAASASSAKARLAAMAGVQPNAEAIASHGDDYLNKRGVVFASPPRPQNASLMGATAPTCIPACRSCQTCTPVFGGQKPHAPVCLPSQCQ